MQKVLLPFMALVFSMISTSTLVLAQADEFALVSSALTLADQGQALGEPNILIAAAVSLKRLTSSQEEADGFLALARFYARGDQTTLGRIAAAETLRATGPVQLTSLTLVPGETHRIIVAPNTFSTALTKAPTSAVRLVVKDVSGDHLCESKEEPCEWASDAPIHLELTGTGDQPTATFVILQ